MSPDQYDIALCENQQRISAIEDHIAHTLAEDLALALRRTTTLENEIANLKSVLSGNVNENVKRAIILKDVVETSGNISRKKAQSILGNCHHNTAMRAMKQAANMFELILIKNGKGRWVLAK